MINKPLVSVVVITYNEESNIKDCLKSILNSDYSRLEVILVDGGSTDRTIKIAKRFKKVKILKSPKKGMAFQRNYGLNKAKGKYLVSFDADMRMHPKLLSNCVSICEKDKDVVALYIPEFILGNSFFNKVRRFERSFYNGTVIDSVRFFKKTAGKKIGFFDIKIKGTGEDWDFDKRIKKIGRTAIADHSLYHNETKMTLKNYLSRKKRYTKVMSDYLVKWGKDDPDVKKQLGFKYRFFTVFLENGKWRKAFSNPLMMFSVLVLKVLTGFSFILGGGVSNE